MENKISQPKESVETSKKVSVKYKEPIPKLPKILDESKGTKVIVKLPKHGTTITFYQPGDLNPESKGYMKKYPIEYEWKGGKFIQKITGSINFDKKDIKISQHV